MLKVAAVSFPPKSPPPPTLWNPPPPPPRFPPPPPDSTPPVLTLYGATAVVLMQKLGSAPEKPFQDPGAICMDVVDGLISGVTVTGLDQIATVEPTTPGAPFQVTYDCVVGPGSYLIKTMLSPYRMIALILSNHHGGQAEVWFLLIDADASLSPSSTPSLLSHRAIALALSNNSLSFTRITLANSSFLDFNSICLMV
jgi:hypothetical protein